MIREVLALLQLLPERGELPLGGGGLLGLREEVGDAGLGEGGREEGGSQ